jgi:hypothetical protein
VSESVRAALQAIVCASTSEQRAVRRARNVLHRTADAAPTGRIAAETGVAIMTVKLSRRRYAQCSLAGLVDAARLSRPPVSREQGDRVIALTLAPPPEGVTRWSARRLGEVWASETTV